MAVQSVMFFLNLTQSCVAKLCHFKAIYFFVISMVTIGDVHLSSLQFNDINIVVALLHRK